MSLVVLAKNWPVAIEFINFYFAATGLATLAVSSEKAASFPMVAALCLVDESNRKRKVRRPSFFCYIQALKQQHAASARGSRYLLRVDPWTPPSPVRQDVGTR
jgi:hypothetical protein